MASAWGIMKMTEMWGVLGDSQGIWELGVSEQDLHEEKAEPKS